MDKETVFLYLDILRDSGVVNMFGAGPWLEDEFGVDIIEARELLIEWMHTFRERHKEVLGE